MLDRKDSDEAPLVTKDAKGNIAVSYDNTSLSEEEGGPKKILIRQTAWRWVMLGAGCFFLMGSYFCFDNPAPLKSTL